MKSNYISKVLSHITSKSQKELVEQELNDHIIEKHNFYEEIGYDDNTSFEKADEIMGDSDVVGEQFEYLSSHRIRKHEIHTAFNILIFVTFIAYVIYDIFTDTYFANFIDKYHVLGYFIMFILTSINLYFGVKEKLIANMPVCFLSYLYLAVMHSGILPYIILTVCGKSISTDAMYGLGTMSSALIFAIIHAILLLIIIFSTVITIKTKTLKNTRFDLKLHKAIKFLSIIVLVVSILAGAYQVPKSVTSFSANKKELENFNSIAIENLDSLIGCNYEEAIDWVTDTFGNDITNPYNPNDIGLYQCIATEFNSKSGNICIRIALDDDNRVNLFIDSTLSDGIDYSYYSNIDITKFNLAIKSGKQDLNSYPLTCELCLYDIDTEYPTASLFYGDNCSPYYINFVYNNNTFVYSESDQIIV
jgi:hypothetical protein